MFAGLALAGLVVCQRNCSRFLFVGEYDHRRDSDETCLVPMVICFVIPSAWRGCGSRIGWVECWQNCSQDDGLVVSWELFSVKLRGVLVLGIVRGVMYRTITVQIGVKVNTYFS